MPVLADRALFGAPRGGRFRQLRRSCDRRPGRQPEMALGEIFLRRRRLRPVRADHAAARILSDPHRAEDPARAMRARWRRYIPLAAALVEFGTGSSQQGAHPDRGGAADRRLCAGRYLGRIPGAGGSRACGATFRASRCCRSSPISPATSSCRRRSARARASASSPARPSAISSREDAAEFLRQAGRILGPGATMIVGVDRIKDEAVLNAAYDDAAGVTAQFNLNILARMNRELGGDFDLAAFRHRAFYNVAGHRIEMHLESLKDQTVTVAGRTFEFREGETIHTENSYKYTVESFRALAESAGWRPVAMLDRRERLFRRACAEAVMSFRAARRSCPASMTSDLPTAHVSWMAGIELRPSTDCRPRPRMTDAMPICEVDPWRMQYFEHVACPADVLISTEDADSLDLVSAPSLGLRQGRGRAEPGARGRAAWRRAEGLSGLLQADHQPEGHGRRQPRAARRRRLRDALRARPHVDDPARRPSCLVRRRGARRQAGVVAPRHRRARARRARSTTGPCTPSRRRRSRRTAARGSRSISPATPACSISKPSAGASSRCICASPTSGRISTARAGSRRWCGSTARALGLSRRRPPRRLQRGAVRPARAALSPSAAGAGRRGARDAVGVERADHLPRGQAAGPARHAAGRLPARDRELLRPRRRAARRARSCAPSSCNPEWAALGTRSVMPGLVPGIHVL